MFRCFIYLLILVSISSCDYYFINPHRHHVGMIPEKSFFGADEFEVCFEERVFPYYYGRDQGGYAQSRDSLKQYFLDNFDNKGFTNTTGYLTVRFIINCKGEIGRFDIKEVGTDFKKTKFNEHISNHILDLIKGIDKWNSIKFYGYDYDSFFHLTFKLNNGDIVEVLG